MSKCLNFQSTLLLKCLIIGTFSFAFGAKISAQTKKTMTPSVYSEWNKIRNLNYSDSANAVIYTLEREIGDKQLCIYNANQNMTFKFWRVNKSGIDVQGRFVVFTHGLAYDSLRTLKVHKTPKEKLPNDSLSIFDITTKHIQIINEVTGFNMPKKWGDYLVYEKNMPSMVTDTLKSSKQKSKKKKNQTIIVRQLSTTKEDTISNVKEYVLAEESPYMLFCQTVDDTSKTFQVFKYDFKNRKSTLVSEAYVDVAQLSMDKSGNKFAFLALETSSDLTKKPFELYYADNIVGKANKIADTKTSFLPKDWLISSDSKIRFSDKGSRITFGTTPLAIEQDTTLLEDDIVNVEIWHHDSPRLYTQMEATMDADKKKTYQVAYDILSKRFYQMEDLDKERAVISEKGDGRYALTIKTQSYQKAVTWLGDLNRDIELLDLQTNKSIRIATDQSDNPSFSPDGKYVYWYNKQDSIWHFYDIQKMKHGVFGNKKTYVFYDEENDVPQLPGDYGVAGWLMGDEAILIYDKYDIWKFDPKNPEKGANLTKGRNSHLKYRYIKLDDEVDFLDPKAVVLLHTFNTVSKEQSYTKFNFNKSIDGGLLTTLYGGAFSLSNDVKKPIKSDKLIFTKENFQIFPDYILSDMDMKTLNTFTKANPQQDDYGWGSSQLFSWINYKGEKNDGMIFLPPNFDATKKYPLIVNFYERSSDEIFRHRAPEAHRSSINYTYYTNLGYVVLNPDISYIKGYPGDDCLNAVNSGVDAILRLGYIDSTLMALQGHSWGGYQIAYMLTKTGRYKCAEAGAPVVNMVSAYGGIRWQSGMSRMFQYEKTQSRIGSTLWEDPAIYHYNSPIYQLEQVTTPVLIMHNDNDGAVPWYQGIEYYMGLRRLGKPTWLLNYNGEPHWPVKWQNRLDFNIRLEQFFAYYLKSAAMPLWMKEGNTPIEKGILNKY